MKRTSILLLFLGMAVGTALADGSAAPSAAFPHHKVFVWAMGKDPGDVATVELDILEALAKQDVEGESSSKVFPKGLPASSAVVIAKMRAEGCDALIALRRVPAVRLDTDATISSLSSFLSHRSRMMNPKNQVEADAMAPINVTNASGNAGWEINKGEVLLFDLKSESLLWRGDSQVKSAKDLPQADYYKLVADKVTSLLSTAGFIAPRKK